MTSKNSIASSSSTPSQERRRVGRPPGKGSRSVSDKLAADTRVFTQLAEQLRGTLDIRLSFDVRCERIRSYAAELFGVAPTWVGFYRVILSDEGACRMLFPGEQFNRFAQTETYRELVRMVTVLRANQTSEVDPIDPQRMATVRLPQSMYETLCAEANLRGMSLNALLISRFIPALDEEFYPAMKKGIRGRKPGKGG